MSINALAAFIADALSFELQAIYVPSRPGECKHAHSNNTRATQELDFRRTVDVRDAVLQTVEFIKAKGAKSFVYHLPVELNHASS